MNQLTRFLLFVFLGFLLSLSFLLIPPIQAQPNLNQKSSLIQEGKTYYDNGNFSQSVEIFQQAIQNYQKAGDYLYQAQTLGFLSLAYQKLGQWEQAQQAINTSLSILTTLPKTHETQRIYAQILNHHGHLLLAIGQAEKALETWKKSQDIYQQVGDKDNVIGSLINQSQALEIMGFYRRAYQTTLQIVNCESSQCQNLTNEQQLSEIIQNIKKNQSPTLQSLGLRSLGNILRIIGELNQSETILQENITIAAQISPQEESQTRLSLGNTQRALASKYQYLKDYQKEQDYRQKALNQYQQATTQAIFPITKIRAQLNQFSLLIESKQLSTAKTLLPTLQQQLTQLPPSYASVYAHVNLAQNILKLKQADQIQVTYPLYPSKTATALYTISPQRGDLVSLENCTERENICVNPNITTYHNVTQILTKAREYATIIDNQKAESLVLGNLGHIYELTQQLQQAQTLTEQALTLAIAQNAPEITYQWQWQLGRIFKQSQKLSPARSFYTNAIDTLKSLRGDLVALNPDIQYNFRDEVEPIYRETIDILLKDTDSPELLKQARNVLEALRLAELDNFFQDACIEDKPINLDEITANSTPPTAVLYAIVLSERLEVILKVPQQPLIHYTTAIPQKQAEQTITTLLNEAKKPIRSPQLLTLSQQVYDWLIRPAETYLVKSNIKILTFVLDGALRNIPMAILNDGNQYLIEKYALVLSPGFNLLAPKPLEKRQLTALIGGADSEEAPSFKTRQLSSLPFVNLEVQQLETALKGEKLFNQTFTKSKLQKIIDSRHFSVVHLATHAQFSSNAEDTYILAWDNPINVKELDQLLRSSRQNQAEKIELLVLSACDTATGDNRATLGLAGVAVRAGARSTLATLWQVSDQATADFMLRFYQILKEQPELTKAEALQKAQLYLLQEQPNSNYKLPYYWASFVLLGNWF